MSFLTEVLEYNKSFVERKEYEPYRTGPLPDKRLVVVSCMDTRLLELLPRAMNLRNGDVKMIKNAGAIVSHPFGSVMRSILVAVYNLDAHEVVVVGHHGCGMTGLDSGKLLEKAKQRGISPELISTLAHAGIDLAHWLTGFDKVEDGVRHSVQVIREHPLLPGDIPVHGLVIHPETGKLDLLVDGYSNVAKEKPQA